MLRSNSVQKIIKLSFILFCLVQQIFSQSSPYKDVSISSPTAASLGKYGDIPVNNHTGIPNISVPIYSIHAGTIQLPLTLDYHASGLKVQEPSGWVGAGWSLNAGGVITRSVQGGPDEKGTNPGGSELYGHFSDYGYNNYLYNISQQDWQSFAKGYKDGEPDLFFYNFGDYSGKFYFRDDRTPVIVPQDDLKIIPGYSPVGNKSIQSFIIITPGGVQYHFGNSPGITGTPPIEITNTITAQNGLSTGTVISSWYLNKVVSPDNQFAINLLYQPENYGFYTLSMFSVDPVAPANSPYEYDLVKNLVQGVRLSQVNFPNGYVNFVAGSVRTDLSDFASSLIDNVNVQAKTLGAIQITDSAGFCKIFNFDYAYFTDNSSPLTGYLGLAGFSAYNLSADKQRLQLNSLQESSCDGTVVIPPYQFTYFNEQVPRRLSFGIDHWGFYNGITGNQSLIPTYRINDGSSVNTVSGANRDASWPAMRGGALQTIKYPTGGSTIFNFEPHTVTSTYQEYQLELQSELVVHLYGQSAITQTGSFTVVGNEPVEILINNTSTNWSPTVSIINSSNEQQGGGPWLVSVSSTLTKSFSLPPGIYQATISFPPNSLPTLINGARLTVSQWKYVTISGDVTVGGLRINSISNYDHVTQGNMVTNYSYLNNSKSSGVLYSRPVYVGIIRNDLIQNGGYWTINGFVPSLSPNGCLTIPNATYFKSPSSIRPMATTQGFHIGYNTVKVSQAGNGYSLYNYYGDSPWPATSGSVVIRDLNTAGCDADAPNYPTAPLPFNYLRGGLKSEEHFDASGEKLKEIGYTMVYENDPVATPGFMLAQKALIGGGTQYLGTNYSLTTAKKVQTQETETIYSPGIGSSFTIKTSYYESAFHNQVTRITTINSKGEQLESKQKYTADFRVPSCEAIPDGIVQYNSDCATCQVIYNSVRSSCNGSSSCLTNAYLDYLKCQTTARIGYVNYQKVNFTDSVNTFKTNHDNAKTAADAELKPVLELQDLNVITQIETGSWKNSQLLKAAFYKYDYSSNQANKVYLSISQAINLAARSATFNQASVNATGTSIIKDSRYKNETSYKFLSGNPAELTTKNGITTAYLWGYGNVFPIAQVTGASNNEVAYTSFEASGSTGNLAYSTAKTADMSTPTGSFCYSLQSGAIQRSGLTSTRKYILSFWSKTGSAIIVTAGKKSNSVAGPVRNDWIFSQLQFTGTTSAILSGTGFIDEVRIYPLDAQMSTYTYNPLMGITSTSDANNKITYYQYDNLYRLKNIKDQNRNITKNLFYNFGLLPSSPLSLVSFKASNATSYILNARLTSKSTGQVFSFNIPIGSRIVTIGNLPPDTYDIKIGPIEAGVTIDMVFQLCSFLSVGPNTTIGNVQVGTTSCNTIFINNNAP